jgi:ArsR family transcriptional regulator, arsenate/arsenite/antimonite-responsive transcriptional repressor
LQECLKILRALSGETRIKLVRLLIQEELCVCELEHILSLTQPAISQQVRILREAGLATARREGNWTFYRVSRQDLTGAFDRISTYLLSHPGETSDDMADEWKRYYALLEQPLRNCPREPRVEQT